MTPSVDALIQQAQIAEREGRRDDARSLYERALYSLKRAHDGRVASSLLRWVGRTYQLDADVDTALDCLEAAIAVGELTGDAAAIGHAINVQGNVEQQQGHLDQAEALYLQARMHAIDSGETRLAAMTAQNLGVIAAVRGDHEKTLRYYKTSLAIVPHARRAEGGSRRAEQHGHAVHGSRALGRRHPRVRRGGRRSPTRSATSRRAF